MKYLYKTTDPDFNILFVPLYDKIDKWYDLYLFYKGYHVSTLESDGCILIPGEDLVRVAFDKVTEDFKQLVKNIYG